MMKLWHIVIGAATVFLLIVGAQVAFADMTVDTSGYTDASVTDPVTLSYTIGSGADVLMLCVISSDPKNGVDTPTFSGSGFSLAATATATEEHVEAWYLIAPTITTADISIANTATQKISLHAASFKAPGASTVAYDTFTKITDGSSANPSLAVTPTNPNSVIMQCMGHGYRNVPTNESDIVIRIFDGGNLSHDSQIKITDLTTSQTLFWTNNADDWSMVNFVIYEDAAPEPGGRRRMIMQ